jgi:hypothetical protein
MKGKFIKCKQCGNDFWLIPSVLKRKGSGQFCSRGCKHLAMLNKEPWNKGLVGAQIAWNKGKSCDWKEEKHHLWKETGYGYSAVHNWVRKYMGKAIKCEECGRTDGRIEWANISHEYKREKEDYKQLCHKCHCKYDRQGHWGDATRRFAL